MRYKPKSIAALQVALGGLPDKMPVEVDPGVQPFPKTVGELRKATAWPENLAITIPQERDPNSAVKVSKVERSDSHDAEVVGSHGVRTMRVMIKFTFPADTGNDAIRSGKVEKVFKQIAQELKPEAARASSPKRSRHGVLLRGPMIVTRMDFL